MNAILNKETYFNKLLESVHNCDICERMCDRRKVLSKHNGNLESKVIFIAEAPGRLGAECTGIPLYGDKTGSNFELLLGNIGWKREDIFISNAILCNPQDEKGNNSTPTVNEITNCSYYLEMILELINPDVIVTLGVKALDALKIIEKHNYVLKENVAQSLDWNGRKLFPLYHMGPRATIHRSIIQQRADFIRLMHLVDPQKGIKKKVVKRSNNKEKANLNDKLTEMVLFILNELKQVSFFKLTKLLYLTDLAFLEKYGESISGSIYLRMQEGPWIPSLKDTVNSIQKQYINVVYKGSKPIVNGNEHELNQYAWSLESDEIDQILEICQKYKTFDDSSIKIAAYMTKPMKYVIKEEKKGRNMTKTPVLYRDSTVLENDTKEL